jgi:hypothetical protein
MVDLPTQVNFFFESRDVKLSGLWNAHSMSKSRCSVVYIFLRHVKWAKGN